jgi:hypothetical protein
MIERIDNALDEFKNNGKCHKKNYSKIFINFSKIFFEDSLNSDNNLFENYAMLLFMKGICLKEMRLYSEAEIYFSEILKK